MNDEPECWYSVEYERNTIPPEWATAKVRLTRGLFQSTRVRRLMRHYLKDGNLVTEEVELWINPDYQPK